MVSTLRERFEKYADLTIETSERRAIRKILLRGGAVDVFVAELAKE